MHLGNGAVSPECVVLGIGVAGAGLAVAAAGLRRQSPTREQMLTAAGLGALVFAAQAVNVSVWPGISAHLVGGVLLAWTLGPALGSLTMALILALQALLLGDGGLAALGANVLNMALAPAAIVAIARRYSHSAASAGLAALVSVPLAAAMIVAETSLFRPASELAGWSSFAALMVGAHVWIGVLEAGVSIGAVVAMRSINIGSAHRRLALCFASAVLLAVVALPLASNFPDGYEAAAEGGGRAALLSEENAKLARAGQFNAMAAAAQQSLVDGVRTSLGTDERALLAGMALLAALLTVSAAATRAAAKPAIQPPQPR